MSLSSKCCLGRYLRRTIDAEAMPPPTRSTAVAKDSRTGEAAPVTT